MTTGHLLILFLPDRTTPGTLTAVLRKHPVQFVEGCAEAGVRARYADRRGVLLTVVDWAPEAVFQPARGAERVTLPSAVLDLLDGVGACTLDPFDCAVVTPGGTLPYAAEIEADRLREPLAVGCRYTVRPAVRLGARGR